MIEINSIWIISLVLLVVSIGFVFMLAKLFTNPIDNDKAIFKRVFPFEVINNLNKGFEFYKIAIFIFAFACISPLFILVKNDGFYSNLNPIAIITTILFGFGGIIFVFLNFFSPSHVKAHLTLVTLLTIMVFAGGIFSTVVSALIYRISNNGTPNLIFGAVSLALALCEIVSVFTFNLKKWANLESKNEVLKRPGFFPLAAFEWFSVLLLSLEEVLYFLILIKY